MMAGCPRAAGVSAGECVAHRALRALCGLRCATLRHISKSLALFSRTSGSASYFLFRACHALNSCVSSIERASLLIEKCVSE
jgi:hypothetical protein